jgi:DNA-binding beta-propeller fold protein YncE
MKWLINGFCLIAVIWLSYNGMGGAPAVAAEAPLIESLGRIREGLSVPTGLDVDGAGNLYVADPRRGAVVKFDKYARQIASFTTVAVSGGLAVTADGSRLYVASGDAVAVLSGDDGSLLGQLGAGAGEFVRAFEIAVDAQGFVFVADSVSLRIRVYDGLGVFRYLFGGPGTGAGQFGMIASLAVDGGAGEVYVADSLSVGTSVKPRIQVFDLGGNLLRTLSSATGFGASPMTFFGGMAFDPFGRGYFLDPLKNQIRILSLPATYLSTYAAAGYEAGQLAGPIDAVFDPSTDRLFVVCGGGRIEVFGIDGGQNPVHTNVKPGLPLPLSPIEGTEVATATPELLFRNAADADGDALSYGVRLLAGEALVAEYAGLPEGEGSSFAAVDVALKENGRYLWSVQAFDGEEVSGWSEPQSFYVNAVQEAPSVPELFAPLSGATLSGDGILSWQAAVDPDPFDTLGYVVEIAADAAFGEPLLQEPASATSVALSDLSGYGALEDGGNYFWRVRAVDNHGVASQGSEPGSFLYDTTLLAVAANMPGARVHLGGSYGYAGRYLGEAPLEVRDFPAGAASVLVERAGFEPFIAQVRPLEGENVAVYAELAPAVAPAELKARPLQAAGADILLGGDAAPFAVDFDNDGLTDLLVGDATGELTLYKKALSAEGAEYFAAGETLALPLVPGATPFAADWDDDGRKDLLVGAADGTVTLFLNTGSEEAPAFDGGTLLQAAGAPIAVGAAAAVAVIDIDGDGDKDLAVGGASGAVRLFVNGGSDAAPQLAPAGNLLTLSSPVAPFFADWDGDGERELLVAASEHLYRYARGADGAFAPVEVLGIGSDLLNHNNGKSAKGAFSLGDRLRLFAYDADGAKGKDLLVGNAAGEVRLVASHGSEKVAAFGGALLEKVAQIDGMLRDSAPELAPQVAELAAAVAAGELKEAARLVRSLEGALPAGTDSLQSVGELRNLL